MIFNCVCVCVSLQEGSQTLWPSSMPTWTSWALWAPSITTSVALTWPSEPTPRCTASWRSLTPSWPRLKGQTPWDIAHSTQLVFNYGAVVTTVIFIGHHEDVTREERDLLVSILACFLCILATVYKFYRKIINDCRLIDRENNFKLQSK